MCKPGFTVRLKLARAVGPHVLPTSKHEEKASLPLSTTGAREWPWCTRRSRQPTASMREIRVDNTHLLGRVVSAVGGVESLVAAIAVREVLALAARAHPQGFTSLQSYLQPIK